MSTLRRGVVSRLSDYRALISHRVHSRAIRPHSVRDSYFYLVKSQTFCLSSDCYVSQIDPPLLCTLRPLSVVFYTVCSIEVVGTSCYVTVLTSHYCGTCLQEPHNGTREVAFVDSWFLCRGTLVQTTGHTGWFENGHSGQVVSMLEVL